MNRLLISFVLLFGLSSISIGQQPESPKGIAVKPVTLEYAAASNESVSQKVIVTNALAEKKQFAVYVSDWRRDTTGAHVYTEPGNDPRSCATWIQLSTNFFELNPGETEELLVTLKHPSDSTKNQHMHWCMLFIETIQEKKVTDTIGLTTTITNKFRVGIHVYQTPPGNPLKGMQLINFQTLDSTKDRFRVICQNIGETQLQCTSYIEIVSLQNGEKFKLNSKEFPIFPEQTRHIDFELPKKLTSGDYLITAIIDAGMELPLEAAQLQIKIN